MAWVDFIICLLFGVLGVHKFREKKTGVGLLYLFTGGLFGIGWLIDCIKYAAIAIKAQNNTATYDNICGKEDQPIQDVRNTPNPKKIGLWILTVVLIILALAYMPSFSSLLALACAALALPIEKWQNTLGQYIKGKIRTIAIIALAVLTLLFAPTPSVTDDISYPSNTLPTYETIERTQETGESTSATAPISSTVSEESTTASTTEATTTPTTIPVTTTAPTTVPTTEPPHIHSFSAATCTSPKTCSCGATEGSANGHSWNNATCTSAKTCSVCGATEGSATGHNYNGGTCSSCGKSDPNYVDNSESITYVLNLENKKFHRTSCSFLPTDNRQDTNKSREELIEEGYVPCKKCHP